MINKTEQEIMEKWTSVDNPLVSICSLAYNHENFIEDALNGLLMQKTDFPFEIIVHDDASTDNTANLIREYAEKFPNIVKPIFQTENQYSKNKSPSRFMYEKVRGKYLALCECDDYWIDINKLQIQIDLMKQNPQCYLSFHAAERRFNDDKFGNVIAKQANGNKIFSISEVILGKGGFCPTASVVFRKEIAFELQNFYGNKRAPVGDYFLQIFGSFNGGILYIDKVMSVYRQGIEGSWTDTMKNMDVRKKFHNDFNKILYKLKNFLDAKYNKKYDLEMNKVISRNHYSYALYCINANMFKEFKKSMKLSYETYNLGTYTYLVYYHLRSFPLAINLLRRLT